MGGLRQGYTGHGREKEQWKRQYQLKEQDCYTYDNFDSIASHLEIDVVYIVLPTALHKAYAESGYFRLEPFLAYTRVKGQSSLGPLNLAINNQQVAQMDQEAKAIIEKRSPIVPGQEGLSDLKVVEAIQRSVASGKREMI